jgi:hypothetical protein
MRFAGCFILLRWRYVRWQWSRWRRRLQQGLIITARGGTPAHITHIITNITAVIIVAAISRGQGAWTPAANRRARR